MLQSIRLLIQYIVISIVLSLLFDAKGVAAVSRAGTRLIRQGTDIKLNNHNTDLAWVQWQSTSGGSLRVGIRDLGLMRLLGFDLLDTYDSTTQPIHWFSSANSLPVQLPSLYLSPNRYLDITAIARSRQWQLSVVGTQLQIVTPSATIDTIKQQPITPTSALPISSEILPAYRKLEITLDKPAFWEYPQIVPSPSASQTPLADDPNASSLPPLKTWIISINAQLDPAMIAEVPTLKDNQLQGLEVNPNSNRTTTLQFNVPVDWRPVVSSFSDPHRLVIEIRPDFLVERDILWMPGLRWRQQYVEISQPEPTSPQRFPVFWLEIDPSQPQLSLEPILSRNTSRVGLTSLLTIAARTQAVAAINGGFFNRNTRFPLGAIRHQGQWLSSPILNRGAMGWTDQGEIYIDRLTRLETLVTSTGERFPIQHLNSGYVEAGISRYTADWGSIYVPVLDREWAIITRNHRIIQHLFRERPVRLPVPIPRDDYLLVIRNHTARVNQMPVGTQVSIESQTQPEAWEAYPQILAAGPLLLRSGQVVLDAGSERFSEAFSGQQAIRSAVGRTADNKLLLITVHNRPLGSGPSLQELAYILEQLGAVDALNLDGGSSSSLYLAGDLINRSPQTAAPVHNGLGVFWQP